MARQWPAEQHAGIQGGVGMQGWGSDGASGLASTANLVGGMQAETTTPSALTLLSEEEIMFRDAVGAFAEEEVRPRVVAVEKAGEVHATVLPKDWERGRMGFEG